MVINAACPPHEPNRHLAEMGTLVLPDQNW